MDYKEITVDNVLPFFDDLRLVEREKEQVIRNIYERSMNETNFNHMSHSLEKLVDYRFVSHKFIIPSGKYIRWITTSDVNNMPLRRGGFVLNDNGEIVTTQYQGNLVRVSKRKSCIFAKMSKEEKFRAMIIQESNGSP